MKPCAYCDVDFEPAVKAQRFCSKTCAALHQRAVSPRPRKPGARKWRAKTPEQRAAYAASTAGRGMRWLLRRWVRRARVAAGR
jgi:hypothetical protein